jgi:intracellular multiplication protein IcmL
MADTHPPATSMQRPQRAILRAANLYALRDRSLYPFTMHLCLWMCLGVIGAFGWAFYERAFKAPAQYYALTQEGGIPLYALDKPNLSQQAVMRWAVEAATTCYTLNFNNYNQVLQVDVRPYFTQAGYDNFITAITQAKLVTSIREKNLVVTAVPTDSPIMIRESPSDKGFSAWQVQFPMLVTYQSASEQVQSNLVLTLLIVQVPTTESIRGIGIAQFLVQARAPTT